MSHGPSYEQIKGEIDKSLEDKKEILEKLSEKKDFNVLGKRVPRIWALEKVLGEAKFGADFEFDDLCHVAVVFSEHPHAIIKKIDTSKALKHPGVVTVFTGKDIPPEKNHFGAPGFFQQIFAVEGGKARFRGDILAAVVAETPSIAEEARELVEVEYEPLPTLTSPFEAMKPDAPKIHDKGNVPYQHVLERGDVEEGFKKADVIIENEYSTSFQDHATIECDVALVIPEKDGTYTVRSTFQAAGYGLKFGAAAVLGISPSKVRVILPYTGGSFGGKGGSAFNVVAVIAAQKTGRPALLYPSREDAMRGYGCRDPYYIKMKTGATKDGKLTAVDIKTVVDKGGYTDTNLYVLRRGMIHSAGPYEVPNFRNEAWVVYTNNQYAVAFRGFGGPQTQFAAECQMDALAEALGMDSIELRLKNALKEGSISITGQEMHSVGAIETLKRVREISEWNRKRREYKKDKGTKRRGIGVSSTYHGIGLGCEGPDYAATTISINEDGSVNFTTGIVDVGQGTYTGFTMIVAETLGLPVSSVHALSFDTKYSPDSAILIAAKKLRDRLKEVAESILGCSKDEVEIVNGKVFSKSKPKEKIDFKDFVKICRDRGVKLEESAQYRSRLIPGRKDVDPGVTWDTETLIGEPYYVYSYCTHITEVEVDTETGEVEILRYYAAHDSGKIIDRLSWEGQVEGGTLMGLGYGLNEELVHKKGKILNPNFESYYLPTSLDTPREFMIIPVEIRTKEGPYGAKGIGEVPLTSGAPAAANAIYHAVGIRVRDLPITPEKICTALKRR
jgi:CO/xanthine dehydrogenase Mo-binding subunit